MIADANAPARDRSWLYAALLALSVAVFLYQASVYWKGVIDDSYITFRFADNLIHGHGLRFNPDGMRVEGYTNFLWMVLMAFAIGLGFDVMFIAKLLGLGFAVLTMLVSFQFCRNLRRRDDVLNVLPAAFLAVNPYFAHWSLMGMETPMATFLVFYTFYRFHKEMHDPGAFLLSPFIASAAAMTRIDSLYFLSPLGAYGLYLLVSSQLALRRLVVWGSIAAVVFGCYFGWKLLYFRDVAPNTYYAKLRLVTDANRTRGKAHIVSYYFDQDGAEESKARPSVPGDSTMLWWLRGGRANSIWWINWWLFSILVIVLYPRVQNVVLIALPLVMNVYFVYYVDGDWMPNFRFFHVVTPFLAIAGPVAIGIVQDALSPRLRWIQVPLIGFFCLALAGTGAELLRVNAVYVFDNDPHWYGREVDWSDLKKVKANYLGGFLPPLGPVSDWMLLNTVKGSIFMSDVGQPMWFCTHLDLYDVDGLTDKYLAHAPSVRGNLKPVQEHYQDVLRERGWTSPTSQMRDAAMVEATRRDFEAHIARNVRYVLEEKKPEYLLIYLQRQGSDPPDKGYPYPEISAGVYNSPLRAQEYEFAQSMVKYGASYNTFFRRKDIAGVQVSDQEKVDRLRRTLQRNPRFAYLVPLTFQEMQKMNPGPAREQARALVLNHVSMLAYNPDMLHGLRLSASAAGDKELVDRLEAIALRESPDDPVLWRSRGEAAWNRGNRAEAIRDLEQAVRHAPPRDNSHHYHLAYLYEQVGNPDKAIATTRDALQRDPDDLRAWTDLATMSLRAAARPNVSPADVLKWKKDSLEGWQNMARLLDGQTHSDVTDSIARLKAEIGQAEHKSAPAPAPTPQGR